MSLDRDPKGRVSNTPANVEGLSPIDLRDSIPGPSTIADFILSDCIVGGICRFTSLPACVLMTSSDIISGSSVITTGVIRLAPREIRLLRDLPCFSESGGTVLLATASISLRFVSSCSAMSLSTSEADVAARSATGTEKDVLGDRLGSREGNRGGSGSERGGKGGGSNRETGVLSPGTELDETEEFRWSGVTSLLVSFKR